CAGLILLSEEISNDDNVYFGTLPIRVKRNAYGRQLGSFSKSALIKELGNFEMTFIRAPYIEDAKYTEVLSQIDGKTVAVKYKNQIGLAFHPELGDDTRIHEKFLELV
ncbi:MAG: pyridoxal 5'-phosphate synthase glutaminase subunit PdxT, partial [Lachnospiraceae bacterium]|nr:pyridoxal 5'-phosphate synthase glutaminase subunit PdxT [Lachnospiraceae bacterium]